MKKYINRIKTFYEGNDKKTMVVYVLLKVFIVVFLIRELIETSFDKAMICVASLILFEVPFLIEKKCKIKIPSLLKIFIFVYIFSAEVLGEVNNFYGNVFWWDIMLHILSGFLGASVGFSLIYISISNVIELSTILKILGAFCFSMTVGVSWELYEFGMDNLFNLDMQRDKYINEINTSILEPMQDNNVISFKDIDYTIIYDNDGYEIKEIDGYLDIGLHDTMKDLIVNFIGAFIFGIFGYLYIIDRDRYKLVERFMIKKVIG